MTIAPVLVASVEGSILMIDGPSTPPDVTVIEGDLAEGRTELAAPSRFGLSAEAICGPAAWNGRSRNAMAADATSSSRPRPSAVLHRSPGRDTV